MSMHLTPTETKIAALIKQAKSNNQIATELGIVNGTVRNHLIRIYFKLNINSRAELIVKDLKE